MRSKTEIEKCPEFDTTDQVELSESDARFKRARHAGNIIGMTMEFESEPAFALRQKRAHAQVISLIDQARKQHDAEEFQKPATFTKQLRMFYSGVMSAILHREVSFEGEVRMQGALYDLRIKALENAVVALFAALQVSDGGVKLNYRGAYKPSMTFKANDLVTDHGSVWIALRDSDKRPGDSDDHQLCVKGRG